MDYFDVVMSRAMQGCRDIEVSLLVFMQLIYLMSDTSFGNASSDIFLLVNIFVLGIYLAGA